MKRAILFSLLFYSLCISSQQRIITIQDEFSGQPIVGAFYNIPGLSNSGMSNERGEIVLNNVSDSSRIIIRKVGYNEFSERLILVGSVVALMNVRSQEVFVYSSRPSEQSPVPFFRLEKTQIDKQNVGQDLPYILDRSVSVFSASDAGNGVGYTYLRLRGSDQTRINVLINGIPYNDQESHQVFWVNVPDLASSTDNIQVTRGIGWSSNGSSSLAGSVNINTSNVRKEAYLEIENTVGSFATVKNTVRAGSGIFKKHFIVDTRFSHIRSDGYVDRASTKLLSYYVSAGYHDDNTDIKLIHFSGKEKTYQAWNGVPQDSLKTNRRYNSSGTDFGQLSTPYPNEVDDYVQSSYQLVFNQKFGDKWKVNGYGFYTLGKGFFEQYKAYQSFSSYGFTNVYTLNDTITSTNLVRQRWLDNDYFGTNINANYTNSKVEIDFGAAYSKYLGKHFGKVVWSEFASTIPFDNKYYEGTGNKSDYNFYARAHYKATDNVSLFADIQFRRIGYKIKGTNNEQQNFDIKSSFNFINPKLGILISLRQAHSFYAYAGIASREPIREDFIAALGRETPKPENMLDLELGYTFKSKNIKTQLNGYFMGYRNQLVLTGALNDVGAALRINTPKSFRAGIEFDANWRIHKVVSISLAANYSANRILNFKETVNTYDANYSKIDSLSLIREYANTPIALSPSFIGSFSLQINPIRGLSIDFPVKVISRQFLDNTGSLEKSINPYILNQCDINYTLPLLTMKELRFGLSIQNFTNRKYSSNGYTFSERYFDGVNVSEVAAYNYYYPQAGIQFYGSFSIRF